MFSFKEMISFILKWMSAENILKKNVLKYGKLFKIDNKLNKQKDIETNSWFDFQQSDFVKNNEIKTSLKIKEQKEFIKAIEIQLYPNKKQRAILQHWLNAYRQMYNKTIQLIKNRFENNKKTILSFKTLRTQYLKPKKQKIIDITNAPSHVLDGAIKLACANYKSALSNLKNKNISKFRIRYWRANKDQLCLDIEKTAFKNHSFYIRKLGKHIKYKTDFKIKNKNKGENNIKFNLSHIMMDSRLIYNQITDAYLLYVPRSKLSQTSKNSGIVGIDPGIRTFATCYSNKDISSICNNAYFKISRLLKLIDKVNNNKKIPEAQKKKSNGKRYTKIKNMVKDLHWKTIQILTSKYKHILIGDLSIKGVSNKMKSKLTKMTKRVGYALSFFTFRERLKYKCESKNIYYEVIDEHYTSQMCGTCTVLNKNLGSSKTFKCEQCKTKLGRDVNGARNILLRGYK